MASRWTGGELLNSDNGCRIRRLPENTEGRDLVIGDPHGCPDKIRNALALVGYDRDSGDRLFFVGDLFDRGPDSIGMAALVDELGAFVTYGNHEAMLVDGLGPLLKGDEPDRKWLDVLVANGGDWVLDELSNLAISTPTQASDRLADILTNVEDLPHVYVVGQGASRFHIIHAELPEGVTDGDIDEVLPGTFRPVDCLTWSRRIMGAETWPEERATLPGLSPTYCGHTPGKTVRRRDGHVCLDLGTFATGRVAVAEPRTGEIEVVEP